MQEFQIRDQLAQIRTRLVRGKSLKEQTLGRETPEDRLLKYIFEPTTGIARSEVLVDPEELIILLGKVERTRDSLFKLGKDFTQHPEYPRLNPFFRTPESNEDHRSNYWDAIGEFETHVVLLPLPDVFNSVPGVEPDASSYIYTVPFEIHADRNRSKVYPGVGARLRLRVMEDSHYLYAKFGFDDDFTLTINFFEDGNWDRSRTGYTHPTELEYQAELLSVNNMTQEEAKIVQHYLDYFEKQKRLA